MQDLSLLTQSERDQLFALMDKADGQEVAQADPVVLPEIAGGADHPFVPDPNNPGHPPVNFTRSFGEAPPPNPAVVQRLATPQQWVEKQINNLVAVGETNYRAGITHPRKDPIQAGIAAQDKYVAKMRDPAVLARRETALRKTNIDEWVSMAERVGAQRLVEGVVARRFKVERAVEVRHRVATEIVARIDAMPDVTDSDRERRMIENLRLLRASKGR